MMEKISFYSDDNFFKEIERITKKYPHNILPSNSSEEFLLMTSQNYYENRKDQFATGLLSRISLITKQAHFFFIEESYTEHTWKELHALHYANTSYTNNNQVRRVHFWNNECNLDLAMSGSYENIATSYLGYVTLRPVPDYHLMLSSIIPNWMALKYSEDAWIMTYDRNVHVFGFDIPIKTTPFYFQDTVFMRCVHADMLMFSMFCHHAYKFPRLSVSDMIEDGKYHQIPHEGLEYTDILNIFAKHKIPVDFYYQSDQTLDPTEKQRNYVATLNSYLESGLPAIIYNDQHVVLAIGHTSGSNSERKFIIYDDSGFFLNRAVGENNFVGAVTADYLFPKEGDTYMIAATYERIYLKSQGYFQFLDKYLSSLESSSDDNFPSSFFDCRNIIVDNTTVKSFLREHCIEMEDEDTRKRLNEFLTSNQPHYLWFSEYTGKKGRWVLLADPTLPPNTWESIFPYDFFMCDLEADGMSLLTHIGCYNIKRREER